MPRLTHSKDSWNTQNFSESFKQEVSQLNSETLPLFAAMSVGSHVIDDKLQVLILNSSETATHIIVKAGVFFSSIIAGCACDDDPTPVNENPEYGEMLFTIDKQSAETAIALTD